MCAFHEKGDRKHTELILISLKAYHITKSRMLLSSAEIF